MPLDPHYLKLQLSRIFGQTTLIRYLRDIGDHQQIRSVLVESPEWLDRWFLSHKTDQAYMEDLHTGLTAWRTLTPYDYPYLVELCAAQCLVQNRATNYIDDDLKLLAMLDQPYLAIQHAQLRVSAQSVFAGLCVIYEVCNKYTALPDQMLSLMIQISQKIDNYDEKSDALLKTVEILLDHGYTAKISTLIEQIPLPLQRAVSHTAWNLMRIQQGSLEVSQIIEHQQYLEKMIDDIDDQPSQIIIRINLGGFLGATQGWESAHHVLKRCWQDIQAYPTAFDRTYLAITFVKILVSEVKDLYWAAKVFLVIQESLQAIPEDTLRGFMYNSVFQELVKMNCYEWAMAIAEKMEYLWMRGEALCVLIYVMSHSDASGVADLWLQFDQLFEKLDEEDDRDYVRRALVLVHTSLQNFENASTEIDTITDIHKRSQAAYGLAFQLAVFGQTEAALKWWLQAQEWRTCGKITIPFIHAVCRFIICLNNIKQTKQRDRLLQILLNEMMVLDDTTQQHEALKLIIPTLVSTGNDDKIDTLRGCFKGLDGAIDEIYGLTLIETGKIEQAVLLASQLNRFGTSGLTILSQLAIVFARRGEMTEVEQLLDRMEAILKVILPLIENSYNEMRMISKYHKFQGEKIQPVISVLCELIIACQHDPQIRIELWKQVFAHINTIQDTEMAIRAQCTLVTTYHQLGQINERDTLFKTLQSIVSTLPSPSPRSEAGFYLIETSLRLNNLDQAVALTEDLDPSEGKDHAITCLIRFYLSIQNIEQAQYWVEFIGDIQIQNEMQHMIYLHQAKKEKFFETFSQLPVIDIHDYARFICNTVLECHQLDANKILTSVARILSWNNNLWGQVYNILLDTK